MEHRRPPHRSLELLAYDTALRTMQTTEMDASWERFAQVAADPPMACGTFVKLNTGFPNQLRSLSGLSMFYCRVRVCVTPPPLANTTRIVIHC